MSRLLTRLPRTIAPAAPLRITRGTSRITTRGIVTDLDTGGTRKRKSKQTADKKTGHIKILPSIKHIVEETIKHPEEWEGVHAERIAFQSLGSQSDNPKAAAHPEEWERLRAEADASDAWEAGIAGRNAGRDTERDVTEAWGSEMASEGMSGAEAVSGSARMMGRDSEGTSERAPEGVGKQKSEGSSTRRSGREAGSTDSNSPDYASPMDAHQSQDLGRATIPIDASTGLGQQPIATSGGFSTAESDIREGSMPNYSVGPNLSVGAASIPSFTLDQPRPAHTAVAAVSSFATASTASTAWISWGFIQSPNVSSWGSSGFTPSKSARSHSTSPNITASTGLSGRRTGSGAGPFAEQQKPKRKTQAQMDEELRMRMEDMAGDGGAAGVEYEDGKPVAMKRGVRENMFRYI